MTGAKIRDGAVALADLSPEVRSRLGLPGPRGEQGARGETGATGATGPAGPTASFAVSTNPSPDVPTSSSGTTVITGALAVPAAGRIVASASLELFQSGAGTAEVRCLLQVLDPSSAVIGSSQLAFAEGRESGFDVQVPLLIGADVGPGTHTVRATCSSVVFGQTFMFDRGDMAGIWVAG